MVKFFLRAFTVKKEVAVGDLLTTASIILSVIALSFSWSQSRELVQRDQANKVRDAAAKTLAKIERWQTISSTLFDEIQPSLVETSEMLAAGRDNRRVFAARDYLYKKILAADQDVRQALRSEEIESAYVYLYGYDPGFRGLFQSSFAKLEAERDNMLSDLLSATQDNVLAYVLNPSLRNSPYYTATLGDSLRNSTTAIEKKYIKRMLRVVEPVEQQLADLVGRSDKDILFHPRQSNIKIQKTGSGGAGSAQVAPPRF